MKEVEENEDSVWQVLGRARRTAPSAFFTANVLREVRRLDSAPRPSGSLLEVWLRMWALPAVTAAVLLVCTVAGFQILPGSSASLIASSPVQSQLDDDILAIASLDTLLMEEDAALWSDIGSL